MASAKTQALYDVHPGVAMVQKWVAELKEKQATRSKNGSRW